MYMYAYTYTINMHTLTNHLVMNYEAYNDTIHSLITQLRTRHSLSRQWHYSDTQFCVCVKLQDVKYLDMCHMCQYLLFFATSLWNYLESWSFPKDIMDKLVLVKLAMYKYMYRK